MNHRVEPKPAPPSVLPKGGMGKVALSMQSSLLGFYTHAGLINALLDSGIKPAKVAGSSAGALAAAAYACGLEGAELKTFILNPGLQSSFREWGALFRGPLVLAAYRGSGFLTGRRAVKYLGKNLPAARVEDTPNARLSIGVTNLTKRRKQLITEGDLAASVVASCAISPIIRAQQIAGDRYIDGGFTDEAPFEHWLDDPEIETILIHRIVPETKNDQGPKTGSFLACWIAAHKLTADELLDRRVESARASGKRVIVHDTIVTPPKMIVSRMRAQANYDHAYQSWMDSPSLIVGSD